MSVRFYKQKPTDKIWNVDHIGVDGELLYSFDKKHILNLWTDYPQKFTPAQKALFDKENPFWADFFKDRT